MMMHGQHDGADLHQAREARDVEHADDAGHRVDLDRRAAPSWCRAWSAGRSPPARPNPTGSSSGRSCAPTGTPRPCCTGSRRRAGTAAPCRTGSPRRRSWESSPRAQLNGVAEPFLTANSRPADEDRQRQHAVDDEDDVHDLLVGGQFGQRQPDHGPQDHQLQDDARRQPESRCGRPAAGTAARSRARTRR